MIRRRALLAAGSALALPALARAQPVPVTVMTPFGFIVDFLELMNAKAGGHFAAAGLDATVMGAAGTVGAVQQLVAGRAQFIRAAAIDVMRAASVQKLPVVAVATLFQGSTFKVISASAKPIARAEDLRGKRIGIVSVGGTTENFLDLMLKKVGIPKEETPREVVGNSPGAFNLIEQGRIDGFIASSNVASVLKRNKAPIEVWSTDRYAPMPGQCMFTTQDVIAQKPELVTAFLRGLKASALEMLKGPVDPLVVRAATQFEIPGLRDRAALVATVEGDNIPLWLSEGRENLLLNVPKLWADGAVTLTEAGLATISDPTPLYTNRFVGPVMGEG